MPDRIATAVLTKFGLTAAIGEPAGDLSGDRFSYTQRTVTG